MKFLGVDQSLREPGVAIVDERGQILAATHLKIRGEVRGGQRLAEILGFIREVCAPHDIVAAAMEGPSLNSTHREFDLGEVSGLVRAEIYAAHRVEPWVVAPTQLKLFATGRGAADKDEVMNAVNKLWGLDVGNDNVADAIVLAQIARYAYTQARPMTRAQADVIVSLTKPKAAKRRAPRKKVTNI
jgi:crossover junction endodeoxyribonuclease RuvC